MSETELQERFDSLALAVASGDATAEKELAALEREIVKAETLQRRTQAADRQRLREHEAQLEAERIAEAEVRRQRASALRDRYREALTRLEHVAGEFAEVVADLEHIAGEHFENGGNLAADGITPRPTYDVSRALATAAFREAPNSRSLRQLVGIAPPDVRQQVAEEQGLLAAPITTSEPYVESPSEFLEDPLDVVRISPAAEDQES